MLNFDDKVISYQQTPDSDSEHQLKNHTLKQPQKTKDLKTLMLFLIHAVGLDIINHLYCNGPQPSLRQGNQTLHYQVSLDSRRPTQPDLHLSLPHSSLPAACDGAGRKTVPGTSVKFVTEQKRKGKKSKKWKRKKKRRTVDVFCDQWPPGGCIIINRESLTVFGEVQKLRVDFTSQLKSTSNLLKSTKTPGVLLHFHTVKVNLPNRSRGVI